MAYVKKTGQVCAATTAEFDVATISGSGSAAVAGPTLSLESSVQTEALIRGTVVAPSAGSANSALETIRVSTAGVPSARWQIRLTGDDLPNGSQYQITRFDDAGANEAAVLTLDRDNRQVEVNGGPLKIDRGASLVLPTANANDGLIGQATVANGATSETVNNVAAPTGALVFVTPVEGPGRAAALANGYGVSAVANNSFTITCANPANAAGMVFNWCVLGSSA